MKTLEILSYISNIVMAISALATVVALFYTAISFSPEIKQFIMSRCADVSKDILEELECFYVRLEQLVDQRYFYEWSEWGRKFDDIFRSHFLITKLKAQRLNDQKVLSHLEEMNKNLLKMPGKLRIIMEHDSEGRLVWKDKVLQATEEFDENWNQFYKEWGLLKEKLLVAALYKKPNK
ncbi:MAG: hypothetical protein PVI40_06775 [Chlamydiota bacterium]|jgi:hypothetical protein